LNTALSNSFDTPGAMQVILRLVKDANKSSDGLQAIEAVARWATKIVGIFGLDASAKPPYDGLGWASAGAATNVDPKVGIKPYAAAYTKVKQDVEDLALDVDSVKTLLNQQDPEAEFSELEKGGEQDMEKLALPYLRATSRLRDELRTISSATPATLEPKAKQAVLSLSDRIRDYDLTDLGVQLDDQIDKPSLVKFVPASRLIAARDEKAALLAEKARQKEEGMWLFHCSFSNTLLLTRSAM